ncbi:MAG: Protein translocase subunit SecD [Caldanaerobacter subterraneus]|jgi:preprotein translocase subunit SecD|uniref:Protein translocase subunit SecD n=2 Tax=Thermoanaerobacter TaxID=1754 RepID=B0K965_THEP3|nr:MULTISPECIES: protein translocase subunit SecD [Thermoanaerobacter]KUJ90509.1 MAG: preprotein translocase subunit SecD [Thermoanaerobacter thermocopriae]KUK35304.1 MAG: Protein translocase subunit SecD [Caldanaerobacter subterraneus]ABY92751.1 protein-export membrane protein SecD [Thermoanaerobacter sp. X514]ABY94678.1 protein-export membrane protein SecD [Thermoanaerobacter pseudethanolicus ATCC 33223]ADV79625.1 protein-export membrane protein SecD [Thermoanaerobacter brockii subsp. finnii
MRSRGFIKFFSVVLIAAIVAYVAFFGINVGNYSISPVQKHIRLGLDLRGGVYVLLEAQGDVTQDAIDKAIAVIKNRVDALGVTQPVIAQQGSNRIRVELPGMKDPDKAIEIIGKTAQLKFVGPDGQVILTGANVKDSKAVYGQSQTGVQQPEVTLVLDAEGTKKFAEATQKFIEQPIAILLDDKVISAPTVQNVITNGNAVITGLKDFQEASELATLIRAGSLPVTLKPIAYSSVGATLGPSAYNASVKAGIYGVLLILLFMAVFYRLPGVMADIALLIYILIDLIIYALFNITLDLPGIAGFLLSIGMAVDANVLIFERFKEELWAGKSIRAALEAGFARAFRAIFDANMTTIIGAIILFYMGSGNVKGFALTLLIGVISSLFTAITVTRFLLLALVDLDLTRNIKFYGA